MAKSTRSDSKTSQLGLEVATVYSDRTNSVARSDGWIQPTKIMRWRSSVKSRPDPMVGSGKGAAEMHVQAIGGLSPGGNCFGPLTGATHELSLGGHKGTGPIDGEGEGGP